MRGLLRQKRNFLLFVWPLALLVLCSARAGRDTAEFIYAQKIYRGYSWVMTHLTGWIPFSLGEILLILLPFALAAVLILTIVKIIRNRQRCGQYLFRLFRGLVIVAGFIFLWYEIGCGTNYYRYEFAEYSGLEVRDSSLEELYELCSDLADRTAEAREATGTPDSEVFASSYSNRQRATAAREAMERLGVRYGVLDGYFPRPKAVIHSTFMSEFNITGVYFPWTCEANVNVDIEDYSKAVTMCHELVHIRGFMREDEANYVAYLACRESEDPELVYSGYMLALIHSTNRLYAESPDLYSKIAARYSEGMWRDFKAASEYWDRFEDTVASEVGEKVNDTYLKMNDQTDGTKSYGRMVDLMLAEQRAGRK